MIDKIDNQLALSPLSHYLDFKTIDTESLSAERVAAYILALTEKSKP